jgi:predicted nicotinamide N-methyase
LLAQELRKILSDEVQKRGIKTALELGSGTGLVGIAAAKVLGLQVTLTDHLEEVNHNLASNAKRNDTKCQICLLDWNSPGKSPMDGQTFDIILASDFMYSQEHASLVTAMLSRFTRSQGLALVAYPLRLSNVDMIQSFHSELDGRWIILKHGDLFGYDDWGGQDQVQCKWFLLFNDK